MTENKKKLLHQLDLRQVFESSPRYRPSNDVALSPNGSGDPTACTQHTLDHILAKTSLTRKDIIFLLGLKRKEDIDKLFKKADEIRKRCIGDEVFIRGILEFSNYCRNDCLYCGIRNSNSKLKRYRIIPSEIIRIAENAVNNLGFKTILLQSGEDDFYDAQIIEGIIKGILRRCDCRVALSIGERAVEEYKLWYKAGARRCLIRFETSDKMLFERMHPNFRSPQTKNSPEKRLRLLRELKKIGYQTGTGPLIGLPGQKIETLADDILMLDKLRADMAGMGPFICHPDTPLTEGLDNANSSGKNSRFSKDSKWFENSMIENSMKVKNSTETGPMDNNQGDKNQRKMGDTNMVDISLKMNMSLKMIAITRIACKDIFIPATTALQTLNKANGRELALKAGANLLMPNITPKKYRELYQLYPNKACIYEAPYNCAECVKKVISSVGRKIGKGYGDSLRTLSTRT